MEGRKVFFWGQLPLQVNWDGEMWEMSSSERSLYAHGGVPHGDERGGGRRERCGTLLRSEVSTELVWSAGSDCERPFFHLSSVYVCGCHRMSD